MVSHDFKGWFVYGSQLYQTTTKDSDTDVCLIGGIDTSNESWESDSYNIDSATFNQMLIDHHPTMLEGYSLQFHENMKQLFSFSEDVTLDINLQQLRTTHSHVSSNAFVKAKKKLTVSEDYNRYVSMKSLFHSLRILRFGTQIAIHGHIVEFSECQWLFREIQRDYEANSDEDVLELIKSKYKRLQNEYATTFRKYAPKAST